ncbi:helix-turn-helix transcriptional regulator [Actinomadura graeca]|uniref:Helix-turn-helix transcriptional regulator n=1 Tax=Actinomadura graeca TaxID=2750812 RepID=A0ABX8QQ41_9ACTN|nr:helix-turn-helix domain-containing protein [Actinomadura graeca]QXJ20284.1 helix-turn-helix transcriptional regulator [Actinomadura graeca]
MNEPTDVRRHEIAKRLEYWMARRGLTRQVFADRIGKSVSWVDKVKRGDRQLDRLSVLEKIADILAVPLAALIDPDEARRSQHCADEVEIAQLRDALQRYDGLISDGPGTIATMPALRRSVAYGWTAFQASHYQVATRVLPQLLVDLQRAVRTREGDDRDQAAELLTYGYWLAAGVALKFGRTDLGWVAADRGMVLAESTGDLTLIGGTARRVVHAMAESPDETSRRNAVALVRTVADRLEPGMGTATPAHLSALGMLLLNGSIAAGHQGDARLARDFNSEAATVAGLLGGDRNEHWSAFGPTNVGVHRVAALADLQEGGRVVEYARTLTPQQLATLPRERRANHTIDVARGYAQWGKREEAVSHVLQADALAREEVRCRPATRALIRELVRSYPRGSKPSAAFSVLARDVGVAV